MKPNLLCDPYIWEYPSIALTSNPFKPVGFRCVSDLTNQAIMLILIFTALGVILTVYLNNYNMIFIGSVVGVCFAVPAIATIFTIKGARENFQDADLPVIIPTVDVIGFKNTGIQSKLLGPTKPNAKNPFMNVLVDELKYNPGRPPAESVLDPAVKIQLDDFFRTEFSNDPTDVFGRSQSQRQFITMPSTSIPNDVDSYQNWLYRIPGKTCKEGNPDACVPGTNGGAIPWLSK
jgi:hypothetical protein